MKVPAARGLRRNLLVVLLLWCGIVGLAFAFSDGDSLLQSIGKRLVQVGRQTLSLSLPAPVAGDITAHAATLEAVTADAMTTRDGGGWIRTLSSEGTIDTNNAFFQSIGTNGRSCNSCHRQNAAWSITPSEIQARFTATAGTDPLFRANDGSNSPDVDVSTVDARRHAYSMLLTRGLIRVGMPIPANAEFTLAVADDPYGHANATDLSLFRRPLPSTNLGFLTGVMWDGRETATPFVPPMHAGQDNAALQASLIHQATDATIGHAQAASAPTADQLAQIVAFETSLTTAQVRDDAAELLNTDDAIGGPRVLAQQRFHVGINDTLGADPTGALFNPRSMGLYAGWSRVGNGSLRNHARASIARGEDLFNQHPLTITGVGGLNDALGLSSIAGTCSSCHDAPNVGNHSLALPLNLGLTDASRRTPDMPLYTLRNTTTGATMQTTDPGLALITGKWKDIGRFKGPILRGLAARPPYFHNGSAATLADVVTFYDARFSMHLTAGEKRDLVAFLHSL